MIHFDIKKLGNVPDGGGHKVHGREQGKRNRKTGTGYAYLHNAVDDHSRLAYTEILDDERKETAAGFWRRARASFPAWQPQLQSPPRPHRLGGQPPASRVPNLCGQNS